MFSTYDGAKRRAIELRKTAAEGGVVIPLNVCQAALAEVADFRDWNHLRTALAAGETPSWESTDPQASYQKLAKFLLARGYVSPAVLDDENEFKSDAFSYGILENRVPHLLAGGHLLVLGPPRSGRSSAVELLIDPAMEKNGCAMVLDPLSLSPHHAWKPARNRDLDAPAQAPIKGLDYVSFERMITYKRPANEIAQRFAEEIDSFIEAEHLGQRTLALPDLGLWWGEDTAINAYRYAVRTARKRKVQVIVEIQFIGEMPERWEEIAPSFDQWLIFAKHPAYGRENWQREFNLTDAERKILTGNEPDAERLGSYAIFKNKASQDRAKPMVISL